MKTHPILPVARTSRIEFPPAAPPPPAVRLPWWLIGIGLALLSGSIFLAANALYTPSEGQTPPSTGENASRLDRNTVAVAYVDVEGGVMSLSPGVAGRVAALPVGEGVQVKKGTLLLQVDDAMAQVQLKQAQVDLDASREKLVQAKKMVKQHQQKLRMQEAAVEAATKRQAAAEAQAAKARNLYQQRLGYSQQDVTSLESLAAEAAAGVKAAEEQLALLRITDPNSAIQLAELDVRAKAEQLEKARVGVRECKVTAPEDGKILRTLVTLGEVFAPAPKVAAIQFCPDRPLIVRAEVEQEFASKMAPRVGQKATIEDELIDTGTRWTGEVTQVSAWYTKRREVIVEPLQFNDMRTLEVIILLDPNPKHPLRINQRVRVRLNGE